MRAKVQARAQKAAKHMRQTTILDAITLSGALQVLLSYRVLDAIVTDSVMAQMMRAAHRYEYSAPASETFEDKLSQTASQILQPTGWLIVPTQTGFCLAHCTHPLGTASLFAIDSVAW